MRKSYILMFTLHSCLLVTTSVFAQTAEKPEADARQSTPAKGSGGVGKISTTPAAAAPSTRILITAATTPMDLARVAYAAQGGDKFRNLKSMVLSGSVDLYAPNSVQSLPGKFVIVTAGERSRIEIQSAVFTYRQISDGAQTYTSVPQMELPAPSKYGINVLMKFNQPGYTVSALPDNKKQRAFRISDSEGNATDFYLDSETGRVMSFLIPYQGYVFGVENKSLKEMDGVLVPTSFVQRLELPQGAFFAEYKVKDIKLDQPIADDVFEIPTK